MIWKLKLKLISQNKGIEWFNIWIHVHISLCSEKLTGFVIKPDFIFPQCEDNQKPYTRENNYMFYTELY